VVFGGVKINPQMIKLRRGVDVLVATPGRLLDLYQQNAVRFSQLEILVLDEADRMLDMGFIHDIKKILALLPKKRQNLLFSATFCEEIRKLAKGLVVNPVEVSVTPRNSTAETVNQWIHPVDKSRKPALLAQLCKQHNWSQVLVFTKTKHGANRLSTFLNSKGITSSAIHGNKSQNARTKALAEFKQGEVRVLVATDIAARGLDIDKLPHVVNFELPHVSEDYVHRIGRTGRAGADGHAVSLVCADEFKLLIDIERLIKQVLPREPITDFEPVNKLPESRLDTRPKKIKKPKQPKATGLEQQPDASPSSKPKARRRRPNSPGGSSNGMANSPAQPGKRQAASSGRKSDGASPAQPNRRRRTYHQSNKPATN
jgi:ATP-dependent RNA helicase RhlE